MILQSKTAVVTGSTSGIGLAIARKLAGEGCGVVVNGVRGSRRHRNVGDRPSTLGGDHHV